MTTKARLIPYRWPLLADDQDPQSLEARLAFHLHRLSLTGTMLSSRPFVVDRQMATDLAQGRLPIRMEDIEILASQIPIPPFELTRELFEPEQSEWDFYRVSARHRDVVWSRAKEEWTRAGMSLRQAAHVMGYPPQRVSRAVNASPHHRAEILTYKPARFLMWELKNPEGPAYLIRDL